MEGGDEMIDSIVIRVAKNGFSVNVSSTSNESDALCSTYTSAEYVFNNTVQLVAFVAQIFGMAVSNAVEPQVDEAQLEEDSN